MADVPKNPKPKRSSQFVLAIIFSSISIIGIIIISILLINAKGEDGLQRAQTIFNALLPMIGTWIGAIIAYYFGTQQIEIASQQQEEVVNAVKSLSEANVSMSRVLQENVESQNQLIISSKNP